MAKAITDRTFLDFGRSVDAPSDHIVNQRRSGSIVASGTFSGGSSLRSTDLITGAQSSTTSLLSLASKPVKTDDLPTGRIEPLATTVLQPGATNDQLYIVFLDGPGQGDAPGLTRRINSELGINQPQHLMEHLNGFTAMLTTKQAERLKKCPGVRSIEPDSMVSLAEPINTSNAMAANGSGTTSTNGQSLPYGISMVWGANPTPFMAANNSSKYAFVIDTGVSKNTNDLQVNTIYSRNFTTSNAKDWGDYHGHGTHVAGTIAAINDGDGVIGVAHGTNVISIRVLDRRGSGQTSWIVNGINYAAGLIKSGSLGGVSVANLVANMSLGGSVNGSIDSAIRAAATDNGAGRYLRFAVAAGNSSADVDGFSPANTGDHPNIYTVSAVDSRNMMASFSNFDNLIENNLSDDIDFSAPGVNTQSLSLSGGLATMSGTSMASPHVAGVLLLGTPIPGPISTPVIAGAAGDPFALLA